MPNTSLPNAIITEWAYKRTKRRPLNGTVQRQSKEKPMPNTCSESAISTNTAWRKMTKKLLNGIEQPPNRAMMGLNACLGCPTNAGMVSKRILLNPSGGIWQPPSRVIQPPNINSAKCTDTERVYGKTVRKLLCGTQRRQSRETPPPGWNWPISTTWASWYR